MPDKFLTTHLFIHLSWCIYFNKSHPSNSKSEEFITFKNNLKNLISTTKLNNQILIHVLYYLYLLVNHKTNLFTHTASVIPQFQSSSREKLLSNGVRKNPKELYELLIVLMMISNKSNDDSSYTMKTWENLTPLKIANLKKRELIILKKINYNVFLTHGVYHKWCQQLFSIGVKQNIIIESLSPKSTSISCNVTEEIQQPQPQPQQYLFASNQFSSTTPLFNNYPITPKSPNLELLYQPQQYIPQTQFIPKQQNKRSFHDEFDHPIQAKKPKMFSNSTYLPHPSFSNSSTTTTTTTHLSTPVKSINTFVTPYSSQQYVDTQALPLYQPITKFSNQIPQQDFPHPNNCSCCALTNLTNSYHSYLQVKL